MKRKHILFMLIATIFTGAIIFTGADVAGAKQPDRPKGLEDRGPLSEINFIHYKKAHGKKPDKGGRPSKSSCYGFIGNGAKWKTTEDFSLNPSDSGVTDAQVLSAFSQGVTEWEKYGGSSIFGESMLDSSASYDNGYNEKNEVSFGIDDAGIIGVTTVWGYLSGPPRTRELVEWDMRLNSLFTWGDATLDPTVMDLSNIVVHELGHSAGMDDLYDPACNLETMFGYSTEGETLKRDLHTGDIMGIQKLY